MRVALVASTFLPEPGRLERRVDQLARGLAARGADVEILTQGTAQAMVEQQDRVTIRRFPTVVGPLRFPVAPRLREMLRLTSQTFDIVDVYTRQSPLALAVATSGVQRLVLTPEVPIDVFLSWPYHRATRAIIGTASQIICRCEVERDLLCQVVPRAARRSRVIPDGIDAVALRAAEPFDNAGSIVLSVDRLDRATGVGRAIAALPSLDPQFRLVVIGDGPERGRLAAFAADLHMSSRVEFVGAVSDFMLYRWLRTARVVVTLPSAHSSGSVLTEACAAGLSVVASDLPVLWQAAERVGGDHVTFVSPRCSPLDVAAAIEEAAQLAVGSDSGLLGCAAPSWESVVDSTWNVYRQLIEGSPDSEPNRVASPVIDLTARLDGRGQAPAGPLIAADTRAETHPANGASASPSRHRLGARVNGARKWRQRQGA
jgi:glycosyltransferase involved in cell wall biosynthesis